MRTSEQKTRDLERRVALGDPEAEELLQVERSRGESLLRVTCSGDSCRCGRITRPRINPAEGIVIGKCPTCEGTGRVVFSWRQRWEVAAFFGHPASRRLLEADNWLFPEVFQCTAKGLFCLDDFPLDVLMLAAITAASWFVLPEAHRARDENILQIANDWMVHRTNDHREILRGYNDARVALEESVGDSRLYLASAICANLLGKDEETSRVNARSAIHMSMAQMPSQKLRGDLEKMIRKSVIAWVLRG